MYVQNNSVMNAFKGGGQDLQSDVIHLQKYCGFVAENVYLLNISADFLEIILNSLHKKESLFPEITMTFITVNFVRDTFLDCLSRISKLYLGVWDKNMVLKKDGK